MKPLISVIAVALLLFGESPPPDPGDQATVTRDGRNVTTEIALPGELNVFGDGVKRGRGDGYRIKSPCWHEPFMNAEDMLKFQTDPRTHAKRILADEESFLAHTQQFRDKKDQEGFWWTPNYDAADPEGSACYGELEQFVFVPPNTTPPSGITLEQLAEIARASMTVPEHTIKLNPDAKSFVNLPTWVWLEGIGEPRRTVTAEIPGFMSVTVVATLQSIKIDPGTTEERAETHQEGCGVGGKPYTKGGTFACGVRYLRSSIDQPGEKYTLGVSTVWPVEVVDNVVPVEFPPVEVETTRDVEVGEIQSNVRP
ncbi:hypothetical protein [Nonomuraea cypriaca]|nr:hypothetical protein [Nonomuraea cypriaca]